ncbi:MAG TPA: transposase [Chryseolinea sp.]|nr:transposase [Chryseolinea sp.]
MADTYSQLYVQIVFAVKGRENFLNPAWRGELHKYIGGIILGKKQKPFIVNSALNHIHILYGYRPGDRISDTVRDIKNNSSNFINDKKFLRGRFSWQEGYGAFSYSYSDIDRVYQYIANQEEHHKKKTFKEEYLEILKQNGTEYNEGYLFDWHDER